MKFEFSDSVVDGVSVDSDIAVVNYSKDVFVDGVQIGFISWNVKANLVITFLDRNPQYCRPGSFEMDYEIKDYSNELDEVYIYPEYEEKYKEQLTEIAPDVIEIIEDFDNEVSETIDEDFVDYVRSWV